MNGNEDIKVNSELYVNQATVELLRRRIESDVKANFFRTVGVPIGGAGILAILYAMFVMFPNAVSDKIGGEVEALLHKKPVVKQQIMSDVSSYVYDELTRKGFIREQIETIIEEDQSIKSIFQQVAQAYLSDPKTGQKVIQKQTSDSMKIFIEEEISRPDSSIRKVFVEVINMRIDKLSRKVQDQETRQ